MLIMSKVWSNKIFLAGPYFVVIVSVFYYYEHILVTTIITECSRQVTHASYRLPNLIFPDLSLINDEKVFSKRVFHDLIIGWVMQ